MSNGYALDVNYTFSRLEDNQFGESNCFSNRQGSALDNYDLDASSASRCSTSRIASTSTRPFQLPFGEGRRWLTAAASATRCSAAGR